MDLLDLKKNYLFYKQYHSHSVNKTIHMWCIPLIVWTTSVWLAYISLYSKYQINGALIVTIGYSLYYIYLNWRLGFIMMFFLIINWITASMFYYIPLAWFYALIIHVLCWIGQLIGHIHFERNRPALMDNLLQAFLMAPIFVLMEVVFYLGYFSELEEQLENVGKTPLISGFV